MKQLSQRYSLPPDISEHGHSIDQLINILHWFMVLLFVGWGIFMVRRRRLVVRTDRTQGLAAKV